MAEKPAWTQGDALTFAVKLRRLFETVLDDDGDRYTLEEVAEHVGVTRSYMSQLRKGSKTAPRHPVVAAIADFFGVPPSYFFSDAKSEAINAQMDLVLALSNAADGPARLQALRSLANVRPEDLPKVTRAIENALEQANLPSG